MSDSPEKPKIIIDEDWKTQVEAEKEAARQRTEARPQSATAESASRTANPRRPGGPLPPPTFSFLCTTLATQAMVCLGQMPHPLTGKPEVDLGQAKHFIDTLGMLEEKTKGNLTADEEQLLRDVLYQLRMSFVQTKSSPGPTATESPDAS